jgi:putative salt-induced outer membrane protein
MKIKVLTGSVLALALAGAATAETPVWTGEGSFGAGFNTGNTETSDLGLGLKLARDAGQWTTSLEAVADYAETDGLETKNRAFVAGQLDRDFSERTYGFGRVSYERDEFSGFESRAFAGVGAGYRILTGQQATWSIEGGPGIKIDEVRDITLPGPVIIPGETEQSFSAIGASKFAYAFNDNVKLSNDTNVLYAKTSTQIGNSLAITAALTGALSARFSVDVRYDTDPPLGFEQTDTATRVSLVYAFGN